MHRLVEEYYNNSGNNISLNYKARTISDEKGSFEDFMKKGLPPQPPLSEYALDMLDKWTTSLTGDIPANLKRTNFKKGILEEYGHLTSAQGFSDSIDEYLDKPSTPHYQSKKIQPLEYILANNLDFCEGNIIKYVTRYKEKNGMEDLLKAKDYLNTLIENYK